MTSNSFILRVRLTLLFLLMVGGVCLYWQVKSAPSKNLADVFQAGLTAVDQGAWVQAADSIETLRTDPDYQPHIALLQGLQLQSQGDNANALKLLSQAQNHPDTREASYFHAAQICYRLNELRECLALTDRLLEWNLDHLAAHRLRAAIWFDLGAMEDAIKSLDEVIRLAPQDHRPVYMKAVIYHDFERFQEADQAFEKAYSMVNLNSDSAEKIRLSWSDSLLRLRKHQQVLDLLENSPDTPTVIAKQAEALLNLRKFDEAESRLNIILPESATIPDVAIVAASLYELSNRPNEALKLVEQSLEHHPRHLRLLTAAASASGAAGLVEKAKAYRDQAAELAQLRTQFAGLHQKAIQNPNDAQIRLELAQVAEQLDRIKIARTWYHAAIGLAPNDKKIAKAWEQFQAAYPEVVNP